MAFDPGLAADVEGLIWFGARGKPGLAELIAGHAPRREVHETRARARRAAGRRRPRRSATRRQQGDGRHQRGDHRLPRGARGGADPGRDHRALHRRQPTQAPAGAARRARSAWSRQHRHVGCSPRRCCSSLEQYGEKLEAIVGLIAIAVLLLVMNWFFHKVYWTEWISSLPPAAQGAARTYEARRSRFFSAQVLGLLPARPDQRLPRGLRDRLFLQSLELSRGRGDRLAGARSGLARRSRSPSHVHAPAQAALQADADRHRRAARVRARRDGRPDRAHDAGHRLAVDHVGRLERRRTGSAPGSASSRPGRRSARRSRRSCS